MGPPLEPLQVTIPATKANRTNLRRSLIELGLETSPSKDVMNATARRQQSAKRLHLLNRMNNECKCIEEKLMHKTTP